jgi:hypothetical protein
LRSDTSLDDSPPTFCATSDIGFFLSIQDSQSTYGSKKPQGTAAHPTFATARAR